MSDFVGDASGDDLVWLKDAGHSLDQGQTGYVSVLGQIVLGFGVVNALWHLAALGDDVRWVL